MCMSDMDAVASSMFVLWPIASMMSSMEKPIAVSRTTSEAISPFHAPRDQTRKEDTSSLYADAGAACWNAWAHRPEIATKGNRPQASDAAGAAPGF